MLKLFSIDDITSLKYKDFTIELMLIKINMAYEIS